ncbi:hypothetical protein [Nocardia australiensis]|uniref:hypothetical protein n=1 Tax=Nocardia australiensis TaxID=2887191 RepID=UPI001D141BC1|nr:hypothetical protein [Nocardia australiensis]
MVVVDRVEVVVGDADVVDTSGDVDVMVELAAIVVVVVLVGTVVVVVVVLVGTVVVVLVGAAVVVVGTVVIAVSEVTVMVDGSADTVTVLGSAVTVTVGVSVGVMVTVDIGVEVTASGSCTLNVAWTERLAVAEKLALIDATVEFAAEGSVVVAVVDSVVVAVPVPGSVESAAGWVVPVSAAVSVPETSPGTGTSLGTPDVVLVFVTLVWLRTAPQSKGCMAGSPENASALFASTAGLESARTTSDIPIAVVTNAATTPARDICRRNRSADGPAAGRPHHRRIRGRGSALMSGSATWSSLLSMVCNQLLLSYSRCADRWKP